MIRTFILLSFVMTISFGFSQINSYEYPVYDGKDLGVSYSPIKTVFKFWSPKAEAAMLRIYDDGDTSKAIMELPFSAEKTTGVWTVAVEKDLKNKFYTYQIKHKGKWKNEVPDIYAKAVGVNGKRGMIINLADTNPKNWAKDQSVKYGEMKDAILYELHVRDATIFTNAKQKGKFLGLTEKGLRSKNGYKAGLDYIKSLGITHVHLLPIYDYFTVDESIKNNPQYNWGYDPLNYNTPEGGYSTNPYDGKVRINEFKQLVQTFHKNGLNVVMDVVYNHTMHGEESYFNQLVPGYYHRQNNEGGYSNASACGNETASDRPMFQKFMRESLEYWVKEYHIDGFRFDLMAIHDIETMNLIAQRLRAINPNIVLYGEGWTAGDSPLSEPRRALKKYAHKMDDIAVFCDDIRDGAKGSVFEHKDRGFISRKPDMEESVKFGLVGAGQHDAIDYTKVNYSKAPFTKKPWQMISYTECHDNHTLWDRLLNSVPEADEATKRKMHKLALALVFTGQGIPFLHAGQEFCRTKKGEENSYKSPDDINGIDWDRQGSYNEVLAFTKELISLRKSHPSFGLNTAEEVNTHVNFATNSPNGVIEMYINGVKQDKWQDIYIVYNASEKAVKVPNGYVVGLNTAGTKAGLKAEEVEALGFGVFYKGRK